MNEMNPGTEVICDASRPTVRQILIELGPHYQRCQIRMARLLLKCHNDGLWQQDYDTLEDYLEKEVRISLRTGQELMRVARLCEQFAISDETIESLGWAKIAIVSRHMCSENRDQLLMDVAHYTARELRQKYSKKTDRKFIRESVEQEQEHRDEEGVSRSQLQLNGVIEDALRVAASRTHSHDIQANMEFIAQRFLQTTGFATVLSRTGENN